MSQYRTFKQEKVNVNLSVQHDIVDVKQHEHPSFTINKTSPLFKGHHL